MAAVGDVDFGGVMRDQRQELGLTQEELATAMTKAGYTTSAAAIGNWERNENLPAEPEKVFTLERVLNLPGGTLSRCLGYLPLSAAPIVTTEEALLADRTISEDLRQGLLAAYRSRRRKGR